MNALVLACAVCGAGVDDAGSNSWVVMSLVISALPVLMLGGILTWVVLTVRAAERKQAEEEAAAPRSQP